MNNGLFDGQGHVWAIYPQAEWGIGPYMLEFDLAGLSMGGGFHVNLHHSDVGRYYIGFRRVNDSQMTVYVNRNTWGSDPVLLGTNSNQPALYYGDQNYKIQILFDNGRIDVYLIKQGQEGTYQLPVVSVQDPQPLPPGGISFECLGDSQVWLDNVAVYGPQPAPPPPPETQPPPVETQPPPVKTELPPQKTEPPPSRPVPQYRECEGEDLLHAEDFEDGRAQGWEWEAGWSLEDGRLHGEGHFFAFFYSQADLEDLTVYLVVGLREGRQGLHISGRLSDAGRYFVGLHPEGIGLTKQLKFGPGEQFIDLASRERMLDTNVWHTLEFGMHGNSIQVALDGVDEISVRDREPLPGGIIALETLDDGFALIEEVWVCGTAPRQPEKTEEPAAPVRTEKPAAPVRTEPPKRPQELPDLTVLRIETGLFDGSTGNQLFVITVQNAGGATAYANRIRLREQGGGPAVSRELGSLSAGGERTINIELQIPDGLRGQTSRFEVEVDADGQIRESNEQNNTRLSAGISFPPAGGQTRNGGGGINWNDVFIFGGGGLVTIVVIILILRAFRPRPDRGGPEEPPKEPRGAPPVLPPVRLLDFWLTEGGSGKGRRLKDNQPLIAGQEYSLHAQIVSTGARRGGRASGPRETYPLQAVLYSPPSDFVVRDRRLTMQLPVEGSSLPVFWPFRVTETGLRRARVAVYYGNLLVQSGFVDSEVIDRKDRRGRGRTPEDAVRRVLDYVSSASLAGLDQIPQPAVSIFTNQDAYGSAWFGVYAAGDPVTGFGDGLLRRVEAKRIGARAGLVRKKLLEIEDAYNYASQARDGRSRAHLLSSLEEDLAALACEGWTLYNNLFLASSQVSRQDKIRFDQALHAPGLISIDRCRSTEITMPWAAVYDLEVDTGKRDQIRLCPVIKAELEGHWSEDMGQYRKQPDWLDQPQDCRRNPRCPLGSEDELLTVCPSGFWGFRHQISQPIQLVEPTPAGQLPEAIARAGGGNGAARFDSTIFLQRMRDQKLRLAVGVHPGLSRANQLPVDLTALCPNELEITFESERDRVLELLKQGGFHLYVFYCHGDRDETDLKFKLVFGPLAEERSIYAENLNPLKITWPEQPKPLVLLNGCETVAVTPEMDHGLLDRLHELGAAGVVGTEIQVYPSLAYPFGLEMLQRLLEGASLGETFLAMRREMLRKFTPLGLVYTYYAPAALHLHVEGACPWCAAHGIPAVETGQASARQSV